MGLWAAGCGDDGGGPASATSTSISGVSGTLREFPLVADVDNDGHADIVAVSNGYSSITCDGTKQRGIRVFGDSEGNWVRTRRVWNQHAYSVTKTVSLS